MRFRGDRRRAPGSEASSSFPTLVIMGLEEHSVETAGERCEECGAKLTAAEIKAVLESGGPTLCAIHAAEQEPGLATDEASPPPQ